MSEYAPLHNTAARSTQIHGKSAGIMDAFRHGTPRRDGSLALIFELRGLGWNQNKRRELFPEASVLQHATNDVPVVQN